MRDSEIEKYRRQIADLTECAEDLLDRLAVLEHRIAPGPTISHDEVRRSLSSRWVARWRAFWRPAPRPGGRKGDPKYKPRPSREK